MKKAVLFGLLLTTACWVFGQVEPAPTLYYQLVDGFEKTPTNWQIMSEATAFTTLSRSTEHVTEGTSSLRAKLIFDGSIDFIGIFRNFDKETDLRKIKALVFDIFNASEDSLDLAISFQGGEKWSWNESIPKNLAIGTNTIRFDITKPNYKNEAGGWNFSSAIEDLDRCKRFTLMLYPKNNNEGLIYLDNFRFESDQPFPEVNKPEKTPDKPATPAKTTTKVKSKAKK